MIKLDVWRCFDHTAGGYWDAHIVGQCKRGEECRTSDGDEWYRKADADAEIERLMVLLRAAVNDISTAQESA